MNNNNTSPEILEIKAEMSENDSGAYETPLVLEDDYIELTTEQFEKMVIEKLMESQVYSVAADLTNKYIKSSKTKAKKPAKSGYFFPKSDSSNPHNTEDMEVERGNNGLDSMESAVDGDAIGESKKEQILATDKETGNSVEGVGKELVKDNDNRAKETSKDDVTQVGDNPIKLSENIKKYVLKDKSYLNEESLERILEKYQSKMKGSVFIIQDGHDNVYKIDWSQNKAEILEKHDINHYAKQIALQERLFKLF